MIATTSNPKKLETAHETAVFAALCASGRIDQLFGFANQVAQLERFS